MTLSSTALAIGTNAGSLLVAALVGALMPTVAYFGIRHHAQVFAWMKQTRDTDENAKDLEDAHSYVKEVFEALCELAQQPCGVTELAPLKRLRHLIKASADQLEVLHSELHAVVEHLDVYLTTALPELTATPRLSYSQHHIQLERAMRQEHARTELERAVSRAQQRIRALRRT
ncbi:hypothetical protein F9278_30085 [Streptomyces phaeolivaceus]|uniref:Uncharacterized protein n=1 Tax=Streptomyces phaeolivaceus TaxID=2653200 RepID=A0A5P8KAX8_9ACTN|nr:hypothetical protein [Streptomyces phaeolivaceus]QFQ99699.1 hypothetical protein F9278_30085 [Streptomyces phaeolivaceus]